MATPAALGLGKAREKKLCSVGIHSAEELKQIGSEQAVLAIQGVEIKQLSAARKSELKSYFNQL